MKHATSLALIMASAAFSLMTFAQEQASPPSAVAVASVAPEAEKVDEFIPPQGYQKRIRDGKEVYCRQIVPAGSRIKRTECFTRMQIEAIDQAQRAFREDLRNQGLICADSRCSGGG